MKQPIAIALITLTIFAIAASLPAQAQVFGVNLIANGDAESGPGSLDGSTVGSIPNWTLTGNFTVLQYGAADPTGPFPSPSDPGPPMRGVNFFAGGPANAFSSASQIVGLSLYAAVIDAGAASFELSGYFGGWLSQSDNAVLTATFRDALGASLGSTSIGGVSASDRGNATGLLFRDGTGGLPAGTREVLFTLDMTRLSGTYNDGYADNLSFAVVPEPSSFSLLVGACALLGVIYWRRKSCS